MDLELIKRLFPGASKSTLERNSTFGLKPGMTLNTSSGNQVAGPVESGKRIRQSSKPKMNKLEAEFYATIKDSYPNFPPVRIQAKTFLIANGCRYTPDFTVSSWPQESGPAMETAFEVKGPRFWDDAMVKVKVAAATFPEIAWWLVWKDSGRWMSQRILT